MWSPSLRQGDVLGEVPFPNMARVQLTSYQSPGGTAEGPKPTSHVEASWRYVLVVSHDCEFNEGKRPFFVVARIERLSGDLSAEALEDLKAANDYERAIDQGISAPLDTFILDPIPGVFTESRRANFCALTCLPMNSLSTVRPRKQAELLHEHRIRLRRKLGIFFGRDADVIGRLKGTHP